MVIPEATGAEALATQLPMLHHCNDKTTISLSFRFVSFDATQSSLRYQLIDCLLTGCLIMLFQNYSSQSSAYKCMY